MADKPIGALTLATTFGPSDRLVLEQDNTAKAMLGQTLISLLAVALDGHGGISSIAKTSTTGTNPVVDTYTVTMADGTNTTFTLTNGIKGDKGDQTYVHIRYANTMPDSNDDMTTAPDDYIGIYTGTSAAAPTSYTSYTWYRYKGEAQFVHFRWAAARPTKDSDITSNPDAWIGVYSGPDAVAPASYNSYIWYEYKGETGDAAEVVSKAVEYQAGTSGTVTPAGAWSADIPAVAQGQYLWTRTTVTFNSGTPVMFYSVGRMGIDGTGTGTVTSVNGKVPDSDGNVQMTASDTGALPSSGGSMSGPVNMSGKKITNLPNPTASGDAVPKTYADTVGLTVATHSKTGTTHALVAPAGCSNLKFLATAPFADGDTITLNGVAMAAKTPDGEVLVGGSWASGAVVMCFVQDGTLFFRGGGGGTGKSEIIVAAPTGSTVTATCGGITKTAVEENGTWVFRGCDLGTWIIKATHPAETSPATETVNITEDGQLMRYHVTLAFWKATISTSYPAGLTCTCSNGDVVLTAPDTTGSCVFTVNAPGDWTVEAMSDGLRYYETVAVIEQKEYTAKCRCWLYKKGDKCEAITGGWEKKAASVTFNADSIKVADNTSSRGIVGTVSKCNIASASTLCVNVTRFDAGSGSNDSALDVSTNEDAYATDVESRISSIGVTKLDISRYGHEAYVRVKCCFENDPGSLTFDEVWAE